MRSMAVTAKKIDAGEPTVTYTATFTPGEDGWICAQIVELPEAISQGRTLEEAKAQRERLMGEGWTAPVTSHPADEG